MRVAFAGTPDFAAKALQAILAAGHEVVLVLSQPDRPSGRGMRLTPSAVKTVALQAGLKVLTPVSLSVAKHPEEAVPALEALEQCQCDVFVVAAYGLILPERALFAAKGIGAENQIKSINIHGSILPRWRGAAPVQRAIESEDTESGITLMQMQKGLDTGPALITHRIPIDPLDTSATLFEKLTDLGAQAIVDALANPQTLRITPQNDAQATYANKILKSEAVVDWNRNASAVAARIRAFNPFPGSLVHAPSGDFKVWLARPIEGSGAPGTVLECRKRLVVACATGAIECLKLQRIGKPVMDAVAFLQGFRIEPGEVLR